MLTFTTEHQNSDNRFLSETFHLETSPWQVTMVSTQEVGLVPSTGCSNVQKQQ